MARNNTFTISTSALTEKSMKQIFTAPTFCTTQQEVTDFAEAVQTAYNMFHYHDMEAIVKDCDKTLASILGIIDDEYSFAEDNKKYTDEKMETLSKGSEPQIRLYYAIKAWRTAISEMERYEPFSNIKVKKLCAGFVVAMKLTRSTTNTPVGIDNVISAVSACGDALCDGLTISKEQEKTAREALSGFYNGLMQEYGLKGVQKISNKWFMDALNVCYPLIKASKSKYTEKTGDYSIAGFRRQKSSKSQIFVGLISALFFHYGVETSGKAGKKVLEVF